MKEPLLIPLFVLMLQIRVNNRELRKIVLLQWKPILLKVDVSNLKLIKGALECVWNSN